MNRWPDWWEQAARDLRHARNAVGDEDHEWAAFAAQQAGEKAVKALIHSLGGEPWGHSITALLETLPAAVQTPPPTLETARRLDTHDFPTRYPSGLPAGYPGKLYTRGEAESAIRDAEELVAFCRRHLPR